MAVMTKSEARQKASDIVDNWATATLVTGWIPGSGLLSGAADQVMIRQVADVFSVGVFDLKAMTAQLGGVVGSSIGGATAAELVGLVPVLGWIIKSATLATKAEIIGGAVIDYFATHCSLPD